MWTNRCPDAASVLKNEVAKDSLARYFSVTQNMKLAKFMIAKKVPVSCNKKDSIEELWQKHAVSTQEFYRVEKEIDTGLEDPNVLPTSEESYLNLKIEIASRMLQTCHFCNRKCNVNRMDGMLGYCGCGHEMIVSSIFEHLGEEPELVPSGTVFTMGCTMRCKHCQNYTISQWMERGETYPPERLAQEIHDLRTRGCRNVNLVGGEPTPWLHQWLKTFKHVGLNIPIVWNSNSYYSPQTAQLLAGFTDIYLLDFKYGPGECAKKISDASDYWNVCTENHLDAKKYGEVIVRMLVLPNHIECCTKPIVEWIAENLGPKTRVNIMFQYRPEWRAYEVPELQRRLTENEMEQAVRLAKEAGLVNFIM
jgi:putative pyruvate formate lyase activating enzyme